MRKNSTHIRNNILLLLLGKWFTFLVKIFIISGGNAFDDKLKINQRRLVLQIKLLWTVSALRFTAVKNKMGTMFKSMFISRIGSNLVFENTFSIFSNPK
jgi:hypothetical protein